MWKIFEQLTIIVAMFGLYLFLSIFYAIFVKLAWNISVPYLFGLPELNYLHAWCLLFLSQAFLKGVTVNKDDTEKKNA